MNLRPFLLGFLILACATLVRAQGFDHSHAAWNTLLAKHVKTFSNGNASAVCTSATPSCPDDCA